MHKRINLNQQRQQCQAVCGGGSCYPWVSLREQLGQMTQYLTIITS